MHDLFHAKNLSIRKICEVVGYKRNDKFFSANSCLKREINSEKKVKAKTKTTLDFVKKVSSISKRKDLISVLQVHENVKTAIVKKKNKAIAKYL